MTVGDDQVLIAVLGVTGAGKSTFINKAAGCSLEVGHSITSCTQDIAYAKTRIDGHTVTLIDTPGFDDTERTDADILEGIATWLAATYASGILLSGIILLQPVSSNKVYGSEAKRTRLFKKICGPNAFGNVVIASTMWSDLNNHKVGEQRVEERKASSDFWGDMVNRGAKVVKHENTTASAHAIVRMLLKKRKTALQMQTELDQHDGELGKTSAGAQLSQDLGAVSEKENRKLQELTQELKYAREDRMQLMKELRELHEKVNELERQKIQLENARLNECYKNDNDSGPAWLTALAGLGSAAAAVGTTAVVAAPYFCSVM